MKILLTLLFSALVYSTYITMAEVQDCLSSELGFECKERVDIGVAVSFGVMTTLDAVTVTTIMKDGEPTSLEETVTISIEKSIPKLIYPLIHIHTVPYQPYEEVIKVQNAFIAKQKCVDGSTSSNPSCGWTYQGSYQIKHSQGFCCNKALEILTDPSTWRGEEILGETSNAFNWFSTAHCMRLGELYFHGYEIDQYQRYFEMNFKMSKGEQELEFTLTPASPYFVVDTLYWKLRAEIVGDFEAYTQAPQLDNYILYIPSSPDTHPYVQDYQHNMLLVPREEVTKSGEECDKVGVSFYQFRQQGSNCEASHAGDCLHNQLFHKHNADLQSMIMNPDHETEYLVHGKKIFKGSMEFRSGMEKVLVYTVSSIQNTMVSIKMDIESLAVVQTQSIGIIKEAYVKTFDSLSKDGTMVVNIINYGDLKTDYVVTVTECNMNILSAIPAQSRILEPGEEATLQFNIYTQHNLDTTNECLCTMQSPTGRNYDKIYVVFDTKKHKSKYSWDKQLENQESEATSGGLFGMGSCECGIFDIACIFIKFCVVNIIIMVVIVLGIIAAIIAIIVFFLAGGGNYLPAVCCYFCKTFGCCLKFVGCFTKCMAKTGIKVTQSVVKEATKGKSGKRRRRRRKHKKRSHKKRSHKKKSHKKKSHKKKQSTGVKKDSAPEYPTLEKADIEEYCEQSTVCYMNVSKRSRLGKEMLEVLSEALPLGVHDKFCLVGTIRQKKGTYQFILHADLLHQTWEWDGDEWIQAEESKRIPDKYRGYSVTVEHLTTTISKIPWPNHVVINQPTQM